MLSPMNRSLTRPVTESKIKNVVFSINDEGALEDDGFTTKFFQFYWDMVFGDVIKEIKSFFAGDRLLKSFNHTQICLIPKITDTRDMDQVRPISLCSVFYKIISKVLVHRL